MTTDNGEITKRFWATLGVRDWDMLPDYFDDTSEYWDVPIGRENGATGAANIVARLQLGIAPLASYATHPGSTVVDGDEVVTVHAESWQWDDDHAYTLEFASYQRVVDGIIVEWRDYSDMTALMAAAPQWWHDHLANDDLRWRTPS